jgi:hypothetical protein
LQIGDEAVSFFCVAIKGIATIGEHEGNHHYLILARARGVFSFHAHLYIASNTLKGPAMLPNGKSFGRVSDR